MNTGGIQIKDDPNELRRNFEKLKINQYKRITIPVEYRIKQLKNFREGLKKMQNDICDAIQKDLGRGHFINYLSELMTLDMCIQHVLDHIRDWVKPQKVDTPLLIGPANSLIQYEPLGVALVMGSWNYPIFTTLGPLIDVIAAGNLAIIKPSEISPHTSNIIRKIVVRYLDSSSYICQEGGVEVAKASTSTKFDLIIFTGSGEKGKLVAGAAARNLTPCILELGGKSPAIIDTSANLDHTAAKICMGKFSNCGQTCIAPDYILVLASLKDKFVENLKKYIQKFYDRGQNIQEYGKVINSFHQGRLCDLLKDHQGTVIEGNANAHQDGNLTPTLVLNPARDSPLMKDEIFGPILPIITIDSIDQAIQYVNQGEKPLALYYFGAQDGANSKKVRDQTSSGAYATNDTLFQVGNPNLPFGGVGYSGYGRYHGFEGFKQCSNGKAVFLKPVLNFYPYNQIAPPFTRDKQELIKRLIRITGGISPNIGTRIIGLLVIAWFIQGVARGKITKQHANNVLETIKKILLFLKGTVTKTI